MHYYDFYESPHGQMLLVADDEGLAGVYFDGQKYFPQVESPWRRDAQHATLRQAKRELAEYFGGERKRFDVALAPEGTPFQRSVWKAISSVGFGQTISYGGTCAQGRLPGQRARRGRGDRTQSDRDHRTLPSHRRLERQPDGIRRRSRPKARAARARVGDC